MNKFEKWEWEKGIKDTVIGQRFLINQAYMHFLSTFFDAFGLKKLCKFISRRV